MPEIRSSLSFIRKMRRIDQLYLASVQKVLRDFRRTALDILHRETVRITAIQPIKNEFISVESRVNNISREILQQVDETVLWYMNQQLGNLRRVNIPHLPTVQQLNLNTYTERKQAYEGTILQSPKWIPELVQNFEMNLTRLAIADATIEAAVDRLLSTTISDGRASVLRVASATASTSTKTTTWTAALLATRLLFRNTQTVTRTVYMKQAIAAIDHVTTDCCLRVHGQTQPLEKPFILEGTPRFADKLDSPPFHWNCRTATSLYTERMEEKGITTQDMIDAAQAELQAREETGQRERIWPASSTSRR